MSSHVAPAALSRRRFLSLIGTATTAASAGFFGTIGAFAEEDPILAGRPLVRYPEKTDLLLLTSRPPQLETPMHYFEHAITPNEAFYVRYHTFPPPTDVDLSTWRVRLAGHVEHPLELSLDVLKSEFSPARLVAVNQCSGNSRGSFEPRVLGGQWGDGAMGNAEWTGVRLQDLLRRAGVKAGAVEMAFRVLTNPRRRRFLISPSRSR
jgi:DMSO/TMAO reductase YedYZ molybdopterin-dependent catalytic subunit